MIFTALLCIGLQASAASDPPLSMQAEALLQILEDKNVSDQDRAKAARGLKSLKEDDAVLDQLFRNFPKDEAVATKVIVALREVDGFKVYFKLADIRLPSDASKSFKNFLANEMFCLFSMHAYRILDEHKRRIDHFTRETDRLLRDTDRLLESLPRPEDLRGGAIIIKRKK